MYLVLTLWPTAFGRKSHYWTWKVSIRWASHRHSSCYNQTVVYDAFKRLDVDSLLLDEATSIIILPART
ncbi:hypothetical protein PM082_021193 [Marasmius tenuissimus]|nr:hypothetical protein PM082_021193 [Marasmius tenuissimus]